MAARRDGRGLFLRLSRLGPLEPGSRTSHGPARAALRDGDRRGPHGRRPAPGSSGEPALASLRHARGAGRRRQRLSRLYGPGTLSAQLVRAPPGARDEPGLFRRGRRVDHPAAVASVADRPRGLARRVLGDGRARPGLAGAAQPPARAPARGHRARAGRRPIRPRRCRQPSHGKRRGRSLGRRGLDARARHADGAVLVDRARVFLRSLLLVRRAGAPDEVSDRHRLQRDIRGLGAWIREPGRHPRPDRARPSLRPHRPRVGVDGG